MTGNQSSELAGGKCTASKTIRDSEQSERPYDLTDSKGPYHVIHLLSVRIGH